MTNPEFQKPFTPQGRSNFDNIFRKKYVCVRWSPDKCPVECSCYGHHKRNLGCKGATCWMDSEGSLCMPVTDA